MQKERRRVGPSWPRSMNERIYVKEGDCLSMVMHRQQRYELLEMKICGIDPGLNGGLIRTLLPTPYEVNEVAENTALMLQNRNLILTSRPFLSLPIVRTRICRWIKWANEHPDKVQDVIQDPGIHISEEDV